MIKCEISEEGFPADDTTRFQREELFKHNALQDCKQKLAITIKMSSDPDQASGDEYIPIEHVLGVNRKRIRLLNPYVVRLRRKAPFQAYKLRKIDTVRGVIAKSFDKKSIGIGINESRRLQRDLQSKSVRDEDWSSSLRFGSLFKLSHEDGGCHSYSIKIRDLKQPLHTNTSKTKISIRNKYCDNNNLCSKTNDSLSRRRKRHINNHEYNFARWTPAPDLRRHGYDKSFYKQPIDKTNEEKLDTILYEDQEPRLDTVDKDNDADNDILKYRLKKVTEQKNINSYDDKEILNMDSPETSKAQTYEINTKHKNNLEANLRDSSNDKAGERDFVIYEIGDPDLWYSAQVQLFEKLSTSEGKTVWNDLTKDETATVNTANPHWSNQEVDVQYKPAELLAREEFILPLKDLRLVVPLKHDHQNAFKDKSGEFIIVPVDDVITLDNPKDINKRDENSSDYKTASTGGYEQRHRQVIVRATRALMGGSSDSLKIVSRGAERYLKLPHNKPHYTQMDLEARADDNELILVGVLGRLTTIVSDTTRRVRSTLTVQATNTGLAAARMRVLTRECSPELLDSSNERDEPITGPVILPPKQTKSFRLTVPLQIPVESANCTIALVNDNGDSVAVRDVRIKRDDRCYCVWHCECVCLGEDPKLLCRDMTAAQLLAAGLSTHQRSRHARSVCYPDVVTLNLFVTFIGVLLALLNLGIMKAFLGLILRCVGSWGLHLLLQTPRKLDHYYETSLHHRRVVYDDEGWPVHPDTKERTVRLVSKPMEFVLNVIFFITLPCVMIWDSLKKLTTRVQGVDGSSDANYRTSDVKKCFSSHDVQLQPLLHDETCFKNTCEQSSFVDSEQDDTEYVLMQMQKSRESLAKSQRQQETNATTHWKGSNKAGNVNR